MNKHFIYALILCLPFAFGCQRLIDEAPTGEVQIGDTANSSEPNFVPDADGNLYEISCLQGVSQDEASRGAAQRCIAGTVEEAREGRGFFGVYGGFNYYYPPAFAGTSSSFFCSYVFSFGSSNCINDFFGFNSSFPNYGGYTGSYGGYGYCGHCINARNPSRCQNRCWYGNNNWTWYQY